MSGPEVVTRVLALWPKAAVLYVSGYSENVFHQGEKSPSTAVLLQKPFTQEQLLRKVRALLDRR